MNRLLICVPAALISVAGFSLPALAQDAPPADNTPPAQNDAPRKRLTIGPQIGVFLPSSGTTRDAFGDAWFNYGVGFGVLETANRKGRVSFDFNLLGNTRGSNRAYVAPLGVSYRRAFSDGASRPFVGASANLVPTYLRADNYGVPSRLRFTGGGSVFAGYTFNQTASVQVRYYAIGKSAGFNLSGLSLSAGLRF